jgi:hypothetical protein
MDSDITQLEQEYEAVMSELRGPVPGSGSGVIPAIGWSMRWRTVSRTAAAKANEAIRRTLVPAFSGATVSRDASGRFAPLANLSEQDFPLFTRWFRSLRGMAQTVISQQWSPLRAPFFQRSRSNPTIALEVNPLEIGHYDQNDQTDDIVVDAIGDAMVEKAEVWVGPMLEDFVSKKPYYTYH